VSQRTFRRAGGPGRRTRPIRRASAGLTPTRAGAALAMLVSALAVYGLSATSAFGFAKLQIEGATITTEQVVRERLDLAEGENLFEIATEPLEARIREIPAVAAAEISLGLPDTVAVRIQERVPILVWKIGERRLLIDSNGMLFARLDASTSGLVADLPVIDDQRAASPKLTVGKSLAPVDLDAATRLASLTPAAVGSAATGLSVGVTDGNGFVLSSVPESWVAIFGFYTPSLRTTELVPGQVQALRELLIKVGEPTVATVILADDSTGVYIPKPSTKPSEAPAP
jgi:POTRA domain-containing FtsQ-type protein